MIVPQDRFWIESDWLAGHQHTFNIIDWDQRRWYVLNGSTKLLPEEEEEADEEAIQILKTCLNSLNPTIFSITVNDDKSVKSTSSSPEDDPTLVIEYPQISATASLRDCSTVKLSDLIELDRLGPCVDLVSYIDSDGVQRTSVFKYTIISQRLRLNWNEMHILRGIPGHPGIIPLDRIVVNDEESRVLGFTTPFMPGGTFDVNMDRTFRFEWLKQLTSVVDFLNLEIGILHQDIAPRNLLIHPETDDLQLFDFDRAARVGHPGLLPDRDDVTGVVLTLYEIITKDMEFRDQADLKKQLRSVLTLTEWPVRASLDCDIAVFRKHIHAWVDYRTTLRSSSQQPPSSIDVPELPIPSRVIGHDEQGNPIIGNDIVRRRCDALKEGQHFVQWERPPSGKLT